MRALLFPDEAPNAIRQPKSDRLILPRVFADALGKTPETGPPDLQGDEFVAAHQILIKWANLDSTGQLAQMHETQLQGEFLGDVFCNALGYTRFADGLGRWSLEQHYAISGQTPDAILGNFKAGQSRKPIAVVELKGPLVNLDRSRQSGRTAVQQCWEYLAHTERECRWGVVSNMVSFRLYERDSTPRKYEHFSLQQLRDVNTFRQFYALFHRRGLIENTLNQKPRTLELLLRSINRQREVGEELYDRYSQHRLRLVDHVHKALGYSIDQAIEIVQRLLDRVIFIAFCEDRRLLDEDTIKRTYESVPYPPVNGDRWTAFKRLFRFIDQGNAAANIPAYNGGLFAESDADRIDVLDDNWVNFFRSYP